MKQTNHPRREFLKKAGLSLSAGLLAPLTQWAKPNHPNAESNSKKHITLFQTTDVHCQLHAHDELYWENGKAEFRQAGGYATIASMFKSFRNEQPNALFFDTGDMFQGSKLSVDTLGDALVPVLNACNYDLYLPGNWEVIYGKQRMETLMGKLDAPTICTNMFHDKGDQKKGDFIFKPYLVKEVDGIRVGFLGYTDPLVPIRQSPLYSKGIVYVQPEENLANYIQILRQQEKCDVLILLAHLGLSQQIALSNNPVCAGVDYILGGDTHERVRVPLQGKYAKVLEPGAFGSFIGRLDLYFDHGKLQHDRYTLIDVDPSKHKPDKAVSKLIDKVEKKHKKEINTIIGYSTIPLYRYFVIENPIDTLVLNALHWRFPKTDIVLSNGFRFCPPRTTPNEKGLIPITNGFVVDMLPVDSNIRKAEVSGKQLMEWLEKELNNVFAVDASKRIGGWVVKFKGMNLKFYAFKPMGQRVESVTIGGKPLDMNQVYTVLACEREGDPMDMVCRIKGVKNPERTASTLHRVLGDYIKQHSPITPTPEKNAIALDAPDTLLSQVYGVPYTFH